MNRHLTLAVLLGTALLAGCEKTAVQDITGPAPSARIRFFNFGVGSPAVNFYAGDSKVTAVSATTCFTAKNPPVTATDSACVNTGIESTAGVGFGGVASAGFYSAIAPGQHTFSGRIAATTDKNLAISSVTATIEDGKYYSYFQSGVYNTTTKTVDAFVVEDPFIRNFDYSVAYVRFVNAIHNSQPMALSGTHTETAATVTIGGLVAYKSAGAFTAVPGGFYNLYTRVAGSSTNAITRTGVSFVPGRVYTITARGDMVSGSTPFLDNTLNR